MVKPERLLLLSIILISSCLLSACYSPSSSPATAPEKSEPTITKAPDAGIVKGTILIEQNGKYLPLKNVDLYLSEILMSPNGIAGVAALRAGSDPRTTTDDQGAFKFNNIAPGKYGLVLYLVMRSYLIDQTDKKASMIITVDANRTTDLGILKYQDFPITPAP